MGSMVWLGRGRIAAMVIAACMAGAVAQPAQARLQCVPYAREVSGIEIYGNARLWWGKAAGLYDRGSEPRVGAVMAFRPTSAMPLGHVAVVDEIVDDRRVMLNHANWSGPGKIEKRVLAQDVSEAGDWSAVRVWFAPIGALGSRENPLFGFIYSHAAEPAAAELAGLAEPGNEAGG